MIPMLAGTSVDTSGYTNPTGKPLPIDDKPKKSITIPTPKSPLLTPSGTPKLLAVTVLKFAAIFLDNSQPLLKPTPCNHVSTVKCVVPDLDGALIPT